MSKILEAQLHIQSLRDIRSILGAMRNLSIVEINKVSRFAKFQVKLDEFISKVMNDFSAFYKFKRVKKRSGILFILVGSERGFCGAFNEQIIRYFKKRPAFENKSNLLLVGRKLRSKAEDISKNAEIINAPNTAEEIQNTVSTLIETLTGFVQHEWVIIHNEYDGAKTKTVELRPLEYSIPPSPTNFPFPPLLYLKPDVFYRQLFEQHLYSVLYRVFYLSFLAENKERLRHMSNALDKIEQNFTKMNLQLNALRQEEITEELEIILLDTVGENALVPTHLLRSKRDQYS